MLLFWVFLSRYFITDITLIPHTSCRISYFFRLSSGFLLRIIFLHFHCATPCITPLAEEFHLALYFDRYWFSMILSSIFSSLFQAPPPFTAFSRSAAASACRFRFFIFASEARFLHLLLFHGGFSCSRCIICSAVTRFYAICRPCLFSCRSFCRHHHAFFAIPFTLPFRAFDYLFSFSADALMRRRRYRVYTWRDARRARAADVIVWDATPSPPALSCRWRAVAAALYLPPRRFFRRCFYSRARFCLLRFSDATPPFDAADAELQRAPPPIPSISYFLFFFRKIFRTWRQFLSFSCFLSFFAFLFFIV